MNALARRPRAPRWPCALRLRFVAPDGRVHDGRSVNVSSEGVCLRTLESFPAGTELLLQVEHAGPPSRAMDARVCWSTHDGDSTLLGLQIRRPDPLYVRFVQARQGLRVAPGIFLPPGDEPPPGPVPPELATTTAAVQRKRLTRLPLRLPVRMSMPGVPELRGHTRDLSALGIGLMGAVLPAPGEELVALVHLDERVTVRAEGTMVWRRRATSQGRELFLGGMRIDCAEPRYVEKVIERLRGQKDAPRSRSTGEPDWPE